MTLPFQHGAAQIQEDWQRATDQAVESGRHSLLELGMDRRLPYSLPVLLALAAWKSSRVDVTEPIMVTGGVDALWPVPLLYDLPPTDAVPPRASTLESTAPEIPALAAIAPARRRELAERAGQPVTGSGSGARAGADAPLQLIYGGADEATYLATLATQSARRMQNGTLFAVDLPAAMQPILSSHTQPHAHAHWYGFPLTLLHATTVTAAAANATATRADLTPPAADPWLVWATLVIAVLLVVLALFL